MRKAIYRERNTAFQDIHLVLEDDMDGIPLPEYIAFINEKNVKLPFIFTYIGTYVE